MEQICRLFVGRSIASSRCAAVKKLVLTAYMPRASMTSTASKSPPVTGSRPTESVVVQRITDNLSFRPVLKHSLDTAHRPIVLIYAWLGAKSRHIHKFGDFYLDKGFDVLHIKVGARQILWPPVAQSVVSQIVDFINSPQRRSQPVFVHGFSVGGYLYGETIVRMTSDPALRAIMSERIKGQVFDSPVDFEGVPRGVGMAVTNIVPAQVAIKSTLETYMSIFHKQVTEHYMQSSQAFHENPFRTPSLVFYSKSDVIGTPGPIEVVINGWKKRSVPVWTRCWDDTPHVGHYLRDPVNYTIELNKFLENIGLIKDEGRGREVNELERLRSKL